MGLPTRPPTRPPTKPPGSSPRIRRGRPAVTAWSRRGGPTPAGFPRTPTNRRRLTVALQRAPAARPVVGDDLFEHGGQRPRVDRLAPAHGHGAGGLVVGAARDDC